MATVYGVLSGEVEPTADCPMATNSSAKFDLGRNLATKLWNASRFALAKIESPADELKADELEYVDRWMLARVSSTLQTIETALDQFQVNVYADAVYDLVWRDFCDWYLECIKPTVADSPTQQRVLQSVLDAILRIMHPVCPFVTETIWPHVQSHGAAGGTMLQLPPSELLATAQWPVAEMADGEVISTFERMQALVNDVRRGLSRTGTWPARSHCAARTFGPVFIHRTGCRRHSSPRRRPTRSTSAQNRPRVHGACCSRARNSDAIEPRRDGSGS